MRTDSPCRDFAEGSSMTSAEVGRKGRKGKVMEMILEAELVQLEELTCGVRVSALLA